MSKATSKAPQQISIPVRSMPPGPRGHFLFGIMRDIQKDPLEYLLTATREYGDIIQGRFLFRRCYLVNHPDYIKYILQENHRNYNKDVIDYRLLKVLLGSGLITNEGSSWLHQRRLMQPAFHRQRIAAFGMLMTNATVAMLERWQNFAESGQPLDVEAEMMHLAHYIIGQALFGMNLSNEAHKVVQSFTAVNKLLTDFYYAPFPPLNVPTPRNRRFQAACRALEDVVHTIIKERRQHKKDTGDLLSMLLLARDEETGQGMDDHQLRDEVLTLLFTGQETTSNALSWTWYLLSRYPHIEQRLHAELDEVLGGKLPTAESLAYLPYTQMVLDESMRLYPPLWRISRKAIANDEIGGYHIPANTIIFLSPYTTHRHPAFWENPDVFDPERFTPERSQRRHRYAYFPFGGGPRLCIGNTFALMEAQLILATIAQRYHLRTVPGHAVEPEPMISLRLRYGLPMTIHRA